MLQLGDSLTQISGAASGILASGANAAGAWLAGMVPHRGPAGRVVEKPGHSIAAMVDTPPRACVLLGLDPDLDCADAAGLRSALSAADCVIALSAFSSSALDDLADVILPIAVYGENEGSFVNLNGSWQMFRGAVRPRGESRPAWKILRMLGAQLDLPGFDAVTCADVTAEIQALAGESKPAARATPTLERSSLSIDAGQLELLVEVPMYACDALVRHAAALQQMPQSGDDRVRLNSATAASLGFSNGMRLQLAKDDLAVEAELAIDDSIADGVCLIAGARAALAELAVNGAAVHLQRVSGTAAA